jgi:Tol biopolymer transport system component
LECLEKDPADRCQSAAELARNLKRLKRESSRSRVGSRIQPVAPADDQRKADARGVSGRWRTATIVLTVLLAGAMAILAFRMTTGRPAVDLSSYRYTPFEASGDVTMGRWSPDGKSVAYIRNTEGSADLMVRSLDNPRSTKLATLEEVSTLFWAPGGDGLYFTSGGRLQKIGLAGGEPDTLLAFRVQTAAITPDNHTMAVWTIASRVDSSFGDSSTAFITTPAGGTPRRYIHDDFKRSGAGSPVRMQFSPDGSKIALTLWGAEKAEFWILPWPDGGDKRPRKIFAASDLRQPPVFSWLPDSRRVLLTHDGGMWIGDTDDETLLRITSSATGEDLSSVSPDGRRILYTVGSSNSDVVELPFDGSAMKPLKATSIDEWSGTTSTDGNAMAYITARSGKGEIWLEERGGAGHPIVTRSDFPADDSANIIMAILSPDGKRVVYHRPGKKSLRTLWLSNAEGGKPILMFPDSGWLDNPCWSPDGKRLYISLSPGDSTMNLIVPIGAGDTVHLPDSAWSNGLPAWSPDGKWIAFQQSKSRFGTNKDRILLMSPDGTMTRTLDSPVRPSAWFFCMTWSRDGKTIYIASSVEKTSRLDAVDVATGKSRMIADYGYGIFFGQGYSQMSTASLSADGRGLLVTQTIYKSDLYILDGALEAAK